ADRNRSHWSTSKTPSYTKSVSWQHYHKRESRTYARVKSLNREMVEFKYKKTAKLKILRLSELIFMSE
ncbi:hypothetical protein QU760_23495, partial [Escherichia coli]|nr:hypothetical protein [Escherichia coli]